MDFEFMHKCFPNYTREMWEGNAPSRPGPRMVDGGTCEHWNCERGIADTYKGQVIQADFGGLRNNASLWLWHDKLQITRILADGHFRQFNVNMAGTPPTAGKMEPMSEEEAERYLGECIPNCKIWEMVRERAWEIYRSR